MKVVVIGGSGLIGSKLVQCLRGNGYEPVAASPSSGVDTITGKGLTGALAAAHAVIDVTNSRSTKDAEVLDFFQISTGNLLSAEQAANIKHHVLLSVVGAGRLTDSGYMRAKVSQEKLVRTGKVPYTIVKATQFFEFLAVIAAAGTSGNTVRLPPAFMQPIAAADVAAALTDLAVGKPLNKSIEVAGPECFRLDELIQRFLIATGDPRQVATDSHVRYFGAELDEHSLLPGNTARIASTRFEEWLEHLKSSG